MATVLSGLGRTLIGAGVLVLLFVAYELFGTNLAEARHQRDLKREFTAALAAPSSTAPPSPSSSPSSNVSAPTSTAGPAAAPPPAGDAVAVLRIPRIGVDKAVVQGVGVSDLKKGPGHYPETPMPGQPGNAAVAGHRTTYGAPFYRIDELRPGDDILVTTRQGRFRYVVADTRLVSPDQVEVVAPTADARLTLTSCNPRFSAAQRIVVVATLQGPVAPATPTAPSSVEPGPGGGAPPTASATPSVPAEVVGASGDPSARGPALLWGLAALAVGLLVWALGRRWRRWPAYLLGAVPFLVVLFVFYENLARLIPS